MSSSGKLINSGALITSIVICSETVSVHGSKELTTASIITISLSMAGI